MFFIKLDNDETDMMTVAFLCSRNLFYFMCLSMAVVDCKRGRPQWDQGRAMWENAILHKTQGFFQKHACILEGDTFRDIVVRLQEARGMDEQHLFHSALDSQEYRVVQSTRRGSDGVSTK